MLGLPSLCGTHTHTHRERNQPCHRTRLHLLCHSHSVAMYGGNTHVNASAFFTRRAYWEMCHQPPWQRVRQTLSARPHPSSHIKDTAGHQHESVSHEGMKIQTSSWVHLTRSESKFEFFTPLYSVNLLPVASGLSVVCLLYVPVPAPT